MSDGDQGNGGRSLSGDAGEPLPEEWRTVNSQPRVGRIGDLPSSSSDRRSTGGRFGTLADLGTPVGRSGIGPDDDDDDDDEGENNKGPQSWFTGGERSGLSVQTPDNRRAVPGGNIVRDLLRRAAEAGPSPSAAQPASHRTGLFSGAGHTLGSDEVESQYVPDPNARDVSEATAVRHITFWRNGFSVEDGELMRYDDPQHEHVLSEINAGRAPPQILNVQPGQPVELQVAKRLGEDYQPPPKRAFSGAGVRLGAPVSTSQPEITTSMPGAFLSDTSEPSSSSGSKTTMFEVDHSLPTTSIQIRLADGTRIVCRMNLTHTVMDIRNFINASRPEHQARAYTIGTTFPNRTLEDITQTIQAAGLMNSVVVQRWA